MVQKKTAYIKVMTEFSILIARLVLILLVMLCYIITNSVNVKIAIEKEKIEVVLTNFNLQTTEKRT